MKARFRLFDRFTGNDKGVETITVNDFATAVSAAQEIADHDDATFAIESTEE